MNFSSINLIYVDIKIEEVTVPSNKDTVSA